MTTSTFSSDLDRYVQEYTLASGDDQKKQIMGRILGELQHTIAFLVNKYPDHMSEDLEQEAALAIIEGIGRFDSSKSSFITFASNTIRFRLQDAMRESDLVWIPKDTVAELNRIARAEEEFEKEGRDASHDEIMEAAGIADGRHRHSVMYAAAVSQGAASLDAVFELDGSTATLYDTMAAATMDSCFCDGEEYILEQLEKAKGSLTEDERAVYDLSCGPDGGKMTNMDICRRLGISEPTLINRRKKAIAKIRRRMADWGEAI